MDAEKVDQLETIKAINGEWQLEGFATQQGATPGIKYGFIGIGQAGSKMVDTFAGIRSPQNDEPIYPCMIINSNLGDMKTLRNVPKNRRYPLTGYQNGVGKDPSVGREAFRKNGREIFAAIIEYMDDRDMIYICVGLGGGTGTGAVNELVDAIADSLTIPVAVIASLPKPDEIESLNAYNATAELAPKLSEHREDEYERVYRVLQNIIFLDNQKIVKEHIDDPEVKNMTWDYYSNYKVASTLHEWNIAVNQGSEITLDAADLLRHVLKRGGALTYAKKKIDLRTINSTEELIHDIVTTYEGKNVLANNFDYSDMQAMAVIVVMPRSSEKVNQDTLERVREALQAKLPDVPVYPGFVSHGASNHAIVYTMASIAGLPERARNLQKEAKELLERRKARESKASGFSLGEKLELDTPRANVVQKKKNPFDTSSPAGDSTAPVKKKVNPFE